MYENNNDSYFLSLLMILELTIINMK